MQPVSGLIDNIQKSARKGAMSLATWATLGVVCVGWVSRSQAQDAAPKPSNEMIRVLPDRATVRALCGAAPLRSCEEFVEPIARLLRKQVAQHTEALYQGKALNPWSTGETDKYLPNVDIQKPICNLSDRVSKPAPDLEGRNHLGESCGATSCRVVCRPAQDGGMDCGPEAQSCLKERAWTRGALVQLIWASYDEVVGELKDQRVLNVSGKCNAVLKAGPEAKAVVKKLSDGIRQWSEINGDRPITCKPGARTASAEPGDVLGCDLNAALTIYEKIISQLGACEIFSRAYRDFQLRKPSLEEAIENTLVDSQPGCAPLSASVTGYQACLQSEYDRRIKDRFLKELEDVRESPKNGGTGE